MARRLDSSTLVIATHNAGKLAEMRDLLAPYGLTVHSAGSLGLPEPAETETTFEGNAAIKALAAARAAQLPALADDSGVCVDALDGAPGVYTADWAGPDRNFARAMRNVEEALQEKGATAPEQRTTRFVAVLCLAFPDGHVEQFRGEAPGRLVWPPRGTLGFGYDPMFQPDGHTRTFGEMSAIEKHGLPPLGLGLSHRAKAFVAFAAACLAKP
jgi:XTP/dITP diphosphohydrolase